MEPRPTAPDPPTPPQPVLDGPSLAPWYAQVSGYEWLVLIVASAGWVFDAFEGQLFNLTRQDMLRQLLGPGTENRQKLWGDLFLAVFLAGGTIGGIGFGALADRIGRKPALSATIFIYSIFSGLTFFATQLWHVAVLRFLVAMGVGGEWAVAASLVAEVFPARARARAGGIFHATSILGTWSAAIVGLLVGASWRPAYLVGVLPALLIFAVRRNIREPQRWRAAAQGPHRRGSLRELLGLSPWARRAMVGLLLAAVGLGTFWAVVVAGQDLTREMLLRWGMSPADAGARAKFAYGIVQTAGMGLGLLSFGPLCERLGRRGAFLLMHLCAFAIIPAACYLPQNYPQLLAMLPVFGFFTGGMHAGYAIYFPELFPDRLRATGAGVCFNGGRLIAAPVLWVSAELKTVPGIDLRLALTLLGVLYLIGAMLLLFLPETRGRPLPQQV